VNTPDWIESLDTADWDNPGAITRVLVVANPHMARFQGVAQLNVDFRTRGTPPIRLETKDGETVPCRVVDETLGPVEADGKRRWRFALLFPVLVPPQSLVAVRAVWGLPADNSTFDTECAILPAWETTCHAGTHPVPGPFPPSENPITTNPIP
jgi:hypothetical protein